MFYQNSTNWNFDWVQLADQLPSVFYRQGRLHKLLSLRMPGLGICAGKTIFNLIYRMVILILFSCVFYQHLNLDKKALKEKQFIKSSSFKKTLSFAKKL